MSRKFDPRIIVKIGLIPLKRGKILLYCSKYSRREFTIHQHIMSIVLVQYSKKECEGVHQIFLAFSTSL